MEEFLIKNAKIFGPNKVIENGCLKVNSGKIVEIIEGSIDYNGFSIDALGKWLLPGFIDIHVNGGGGGMSIDATEESIRKIVVSHAKFGTTSLLVTTISVEDKTLLESLKCINNVALEPIIGSKIIGVHLEGPFLSVKKKGAHQEKYLKEPSIGLFDELNRASNNLVKILSIAPELPNSMDLIKHAKSKGIVLGFAHSEANYVTTMKSIQNGINLCTHLFNAMEPLSHKDAGPIGAFLTSNDTFIELISDGVHVNNVVMQLVYKVKDTDKIIIVTDAVSPAGTNITKFSILGMELEVRGKSCFIPETQNLAGSALTMNVAVKTFYENTDCTLLEAINMGSLNPAKLLNLDSKKGSIEMFKDADLIISDSEFNVFCTIVEGKILFNNV